MHEPVTTGSEQPAVVVRCLGTFSLTLHGKPVERWRAGKSRNLFQFLLMNRGQVMLKERLHDLLWPAAEGSSATSLRVAVHALRRILDAESEGGNAPLHVSFEDVGYVLSGHDVWVDVDAFGAACDEGRVASARGDGEGAVAAYRRAVDLYSGDFLAQEDADWVEEVRQWNRTCLLQALSTLRDDALRRGDTDIAADLSCRTLQVDPYHEDSYRTLITEHASRGERGQAKRWYELCRRRLGELAVAPDRATRTALAEAVGLGPSSGMTPAAEG